MNHIRNVISENKSSRIEYLFLYRVELFKNNRGFFIAFPENEEY